MKDLFAIVVIVLSVLAAAGCSSESPAPSAEENTEGPRSQVGDGEGALAIVAWAGYIERGETDPKFNWVTSFEQATSCKVSVKVAATSDEMVALMNEGGFDLVTASGDASPRLISGG